MFLITGLPRCRSAWFATLFNSLGVDTVHDWTRRFRNTEMMEKWLKEPGLKGWCDPQAIWILSHTKRVFKGQPIVVIDRPVDEAHRAYEKWSGEQVSRGLFIEAKERLDTLDARHFSFADLNKYETVKELVRYCTGLDLPQKTYDRFSHLHIEQRK